nr:hypothetical protein BaRGS_004659 [Batillaria attramentaria]
MGYDIERFVDVVNEGLLCCICRDVLEEPLQAPWDNRLFVCPCRPLFRYMRNDLARLQIRCKNHLIGCQHVSQLEYVSVHEAVCPLEEVRCPHGCGVRLPRADMADHAESCGMVGRGENREGERQCTKGCGLTLTSLDEKEHNCIEELRSAVEMLRSEMVCKLEDQRHETELRLDMQRGHMIQREAALKGQIDELKAELARISQKVKLLMDMEQQRRQDVDRMQEERLELLDLLRNIQQEQEAAPQRCHHCATRARASPSPGGGRVTTL